jgi:hypothetical protein
MKNLLMLIALLLSLCTAVSADCTNAGRDRCLLGSHSVCVEQCDPNIPTCVKICKCHCEKDQ